jgi:uncharacterized protein
VHTQLSALPMPLTWQVPPSHCRSDEAARLSVRAPANTDMFADPGDDSSPVLTAPRLLGPAPDGDFQLAARVRVDFAHTYDAGVLLVWVDERTWAKLCFEYSPQGRPMAVSVVTRGRSDDANGFTVDGNELWLRVSRLGGAWAFHASTDGSSWHFVRYFTLGSDAGPASVGFEAQSPTGPGVDVTFDQIRFVSERLADLRTGV